VLFQAGRLRLVAVRVEEPDQDILMNLEVSLTGAPAGEYQVAFVVRDGNSPKTATVAQRVTLK